MNDQVNPYPFLTENTNKLATSKANTRRSKTYSLHPTKRPLFA